MTKGRFLLTGKQLRLYLRTSVRARFSLAADRFKFHGRGNVNDPQPVIGSRIPILLMPAENLDPCQFVETSGRRRQVEFSGNQVKERC